MIAIILNNLRLIACISAALACFAYGWHINGILWERRSDSMLNQQAERLIGQCKDQQKLTQGIDHETLEKLRSRDVRIADYKRLHPAPESVPIARTPGNSDAAGRGSVDDRPHAVADYTFLDYAAIAERYRVQLIGCQNFINRVWEQK